MDFLSGYVPMCVWIFEYYIQIYILFSTVMILRKLVNIMAMVQPEITQSCLPDVAEIRDRLQLRGLDWTPTWCLAWWPTLCVASGTDAHTSLVAHEYSL